MFIKTTDYKLLNTAYIKSLEIKSRDVGIQIIATDINDKDYMVSEHSDFNEAYKHMNKVCELYNIYCI